MSRYPNRIPTRTPQAPKKEEESVVNLFKRAEDRPISPTISTEEYWANRSVKNQYGIQTYKNTHRPTEDSELKKLMANVSTCKVKNDRGEDISISVSSANRVQEISTAYKSLTYQNCKSIEDVTDKYEYRMDLQNGFKVYNLYRYDNFLKRDTVYMTIAVK